MVTCANTHWICLAMNARVIVGSFTMTFVFTSTRLRHVEVLVSPTFPVKFNAEISIPFLFRRLFTAVAENKISTLYTFCMITFKEG